MVRVGYVLVATVTVLVTGPFLDFESKVTLISPFSPGGIGALGGTVVVQPQDAMVELMIKSDFPVLVNTKV